MVPSRKKNEQNSDKAFFFLLLGVRTLLLVTPTLKDNNGTRMEAVLLALVLMELHNVPLCVLLLSQHLHHLPVTVTPKMVK
jgi:hypothetical protein